MNASEFFQISADFELRSKPDWLDAYRTKYDLPYDYHMTFKVTTHCRSEDLDKMKAELAEMAENQKPITVVFDELFIAPTSKGWCIMVKAQDSPELRGLQKEISDKFAQYGAIINSEREDYEKNFKPHITIARRLTDEQLEQAKSELKPDLACDTVIQNLVLTTVPEDKFEEWSKAENRIFYKLK